MREISKDELNTIRLIMKVSKPCVREYCRYCCIDCEHLLKCYARWKGHRMGLHSLCLRDEKKTWCYVTFRMLEDILTCRKKKL